MTTIRAWPFLIGRVRNAGNRVVVAPDFLLESHNDGVLHSISRGSDTHADEAVYDRLPDDGVVVISRVFEAHATDYDLAGEDIANDDVLRDRSSRPIRLTEGLVLRTESGGPPRITTEDLLAAHRAVVPAYREFWFHEAEYRPRPSTALSAGEPSGVAMPLTLRQGTPIARNDTKRPRSPMPFPNWTRDRANATIFPRRPLNYFGIIVAIVILVSATVTIVGVVGSDHRPTTAQQRPGCDKACAGIVDGIYQQLQPVPTEAHRVFCGLYNVHHNVDETTSILENPANPDIQKFADTADQATAERRREEAEVLALEITKQATERAKKNDGVDVTMVKKSVADRICSDH